METLSEQLYERQLQAETNENLKNQISEQCKLINGGFCQASLCGCKPIVHPIKHVCTYALAYQIGIRDAKKGFVGCSNDDIDTSIMVLQ